MQNSNDAGVRIERFIARLWKCATVVSSITRLGIKQVCRRSFEFLILFISLILLVDALAFYKYAYLRFLHWIWPHTITPWTVTHLELIPPIWHLSFILVSSALLASIIFGILPYAKRRKFQDKLDTVGLTNGKGGTPFVIDAEHVNENRTKLIVVGNGVGEDRFQAKHGDLESSFGQIIESIKASANKKMVEILLCKQALTKMLPFKETFPLLMTPYTFVVGESSSGIVQQNLRELPHLLIAGSTGGGKSFFLRQLLISLLYSSPHLQLYLIDLKLGVDLKEFSQLKNVRLAKTEAEAVKILRALRDEMKRRFAVMEERGIKKIEPEKQKMDLIVLAVDEASVLYGKVSRSNSKYDLVNEARELTDELAKLARAAGIHLILATQKSVKDAIDTKTLDNLTGRMVFKMPSHAGSNVALGNGEAYSLPDIKGRGIWAGGNQFIELQTPFLPEDDVDKECKRLAEISENDSTRAIFGPMLEPMSKKPKGESVLQKVMSNDEAA